MNGSRNMTANLIGDIAKALGATSSNLDKIDVLVCPPAPYLALAKSEIVNNGGFIKLGAQNINAHEVGAYTGEVAYSMLVDLGCEYVLLGHSERRELFLESDQIVAEKFASCLRQGDSVIPVLCVGETLEQRHRGDTEQVVGKQIDAVLALTGVEGFSNAVIAYEPVWAIGTGETATPEQAQSVHAFIRNKISGLDDAIASRLQILYGGSMNEKNANELLAQNDIDGGLIGGAALKADSFTKICSAAIELTN